MSDCLKDCIQIWIIFYELGAKTLTYPSWHSMLPVTTKTA